MRRFSVALRAALDRARRQCSNPLIVPDAQTPHRTPPTSRAAAPWLLSAAVYLALALALCHRVLPDFTTTLPSDPGDPILNTWILWWNAHAVPLTERWWNAPFFFPFPGALALSETLLGIAIVTTPLQWLGLQPVATYNVAFIGSFAASALAMHVLVWRLTRRHDAALVAGLVYGFNPYRTAQAPHLQMVSSYWLPLALTGLHDFVERGRTHSLALFAAAWLLQALVSGYFLLYSSVLIALWLVWLAPSWRKAAAVGVAWIAAAVACLPVLLEYQRVQEGANLARPITEIESLGADLSALIAPTERLIVWGDRLMGRRMEGELFVGFTAAVLIALAVRRRLHRPIGRGSVAFVALAAIPLAVGLASFWLGGFAFAVGPVRVSVARAFKPIGVAVWLVLAAVLASRPFRAAWRCRSVFGFYVFAAGVMILFAFGPTPRAWGHRFWYMPPYRWLLELPGFSGVRVPARFGALLIVCVAVAAGLAFDRLRPAAARAGRMFLAAVLAGVAIDSAARIPGVRMPGTIASPELQRMTSIVELPLGDVDSDLRAMFHSIAHRRPIVNGYSGYTPPHYHAVVIGLERGDARALAALAREGPLGVLVADGRTADHERLLAEAGARRLGQHGGMALFEIAARSTADPDCGGSPIPIASIRASTGNDPARMHDGQVLTGWHTDDPQRGGEQVVLDLGEVRRVEVITLSHGPYVRDFARRLRVEVSGDGAQWTEVWHADLASYAAEGALRDPKRLPARILMPAAAVGRFIALTQTSDAHDATWSIAEAEVCGR